jgi:type VI protein secretion system component Hcp
VATSDIAASAATTSASSAAGTSTASAAVPVPASSPLHYFLKVDGVTGDSTVKGFEGWFAVDGYDISVQHTTSIGSASGGAGAGKAQFSPLTVDIHSLAGLAPLLGDVASGHALKSVELVGVETLKDQNIKVYDVNLSDVLVSSFQQDPSAKGVETALSFDFAKIARPISRWRRTGLSALRRPLAGTYSRTRRTPRWPQAISPLALRRRLLPVRQPPPPRQLPSRFQRQAPCTTTSRLTG